MVRDAEGKIIPGVLMGGDLVAMRKTIARAIGSGKRAFLACLEYMNGMDWEAAAAIIVTGPHSVGLDATLAGRAYSPAVAGPEAINIDHFVPARPRMQKANASEAMLHGFQEVRETLQEDAAQAEANRCFNCGVCNMCLKCFANCPDSSIRISADGKSLEVDYNYCKGCGICVEECPRGAMNMVWEEK
jgi:Pyruvate/2-oxoacid:ferredoxin oxidoreductase delta subunit